MVVYKLLLNCAINLVRYKPCVLCCKLLFLRQVLVFFQVLVNLFEYSGVITRGGWCISRCLGRIPVAVPSRTRFTRLRYFLTVFGDVPVYRATCRLDLQSSYKSTIRHMSVSVLHLTSHLTRSRYWVELVFRWIKIGLAFSRLVDQKGIGENRCTLNGAPPLAAWASP